MYIYIQYKIYLRQTSIARSETVSSNHSLIINPKKSTHSRPSFLAEKQKRKKKRKKSGYPTKENLSFFRPRIFVYERGRKLSGCLDEVGRA